MARNSSRSKRVKAPARETSPTGTTRFSWWLLAPGAVGIFLGGGAREWLFGWILIAAGIAVWKCHGLWIARPRLQLVLIIFAAWGLTAFLPRFLALQGVPEWRRNLTGDLGISLPPTIAAQPWMALEPWILLLSGCGFAFFLTAHSFSLQTRKSIVEGSALLAAVIAILSMASFYGGFRVPGWESVAGFGPFPSRNQTGNLFGISTVLAAALAFEGFSEQKNLRGAGWSCVLVLLIVAAAMTTSRGGLLVAFACLIGWGVFMSISYVKSTTRLAVSISVLLIMMAMVLGFGGKTVDRLFPDPETAQTTETDMRIAIARDVARMSLDSPVFGFGLGNFDAVFPFYRTAPGEARAVHPDSDWLLLVAEMGWPALVLAVTGLVFFVQGLGPMSRNSGRTIRSAAAASALGFALHGIGDISGHRPSTLFFVLPIAMSALHPGQVLHPLSFKMVAWIRRGGLVAAAMGFIFVGAGLGLWIFPGQSSSIKFRERAATALVEQNLPGSIELCDYGLAFAPMAWDLYFQRGATEIVAGEISSARDDFRRARFLEPRHSVVPFREGFLWWPVSPASAFSAWREALERVQIPPENILGPVQQRVGKGEEWEAEITALVNVRRSELWVGYMRYLEPPVFELALKETREEDPSLSFLTEAQRRLLFIDWQQKLGLPSLMEGIQSEPGWNDSGWFWTASEMAKQGRTDQAYLFARPFVDNPKIPTASVPQNPAGFEARLLREPDNYSLYLGLATYYANAKQFQEVIRVLDLLPPTAPTYFIYLEAEAAANARNWELAWKKLAEYAEKANLR